MDSKTIDKTLRTVEIFGTHTEWKVGKYECVDGVIRPTNGSRQRSYSPMDRYRESRTGNGSSPHLELFSLVQANRGGHAPTQGILEWCNKYGLLGIVPSLMRQMVLPAVWVPYQKIGKKVTFVPYQETHSAATGGWRRSPDYRLKSETHGKKPWEIVPVDQLAAHGMEPPSVLFKWFGLGNLAKTAFASNSFPIYNFFGVPTAQIETYRYPCPHSAEFWNQYQEPILEFWDYATLLWNAFRLLSTQKLEDFQDPKTLRLGVELLNNLLEGYSPQIVATPENPKPELSFYSSSLLCSLAQMVYLDLAEGFRPKQCPSCNKYFSGRDTKADYCSQTCKSRINKRVQRERKRQLERNRNTRAAAKASARGTTKKGSN
jgi:hypothetical protein